MLVFILLQQQPKHWSDDGVLLKQEVNYLIIRIVSVRRAGSETPADLHQNVLPFGGGGGGLSWWCAEGLGPSWKMRRIRSLITIRLRLPVKWICWSALSALGRSSNATALSAHQPVCWRRSSWWKKGADTRVITWHGRRDVIVPYCV